MRFQAIYSFHNVYKYTKTGNGVKPYSNIISSSARLYS